MNKLNENTPRLSLENINNIICTYEYDEFLTKINDIAGAPDSEFGSCITYYAYFINDQKNEFICISFLGVIQHIIINQDGSTQSEIIYSYNNFINEYSLNPIPTKEPKMSEILLHREPVATPLKPIHE